MRPPRTRIGRALLLGIIGSLIAAPAWVWLRDAPTPPANWHGYTIERDDVLAFNDGQPVQYAMDMWLGAGALASELQRQADGCDPASMGRSIVGRDHRGVMLCNTAGLSEGEFAVARELFQSEVDAMHDRYALEWAWLIGQRLTLMLAAVGVLAAAAWAVRWVRQGQTA
jgi:hypothetical protein